MSEYWLKVTLRDSSDCAGCPAKRKNRCKAAVIGLVTLYLNDGTSCPDRPSDCPLLKYAAPPMDGTLLLASCSDGRRRLLRYVTFIDHAGFWSEDKQELLAASDIVTWSEVNENS